MDDMLDTPPMPETQPVLAIVCPMCRDSFVDVEDRLPEIWEAHIRFRGHIHVAAW